MANNEIELHRSKLEGDLQFIRLIFKAAEKSPAILSDDQRDSLKSINLTLQENCQNNPSSAVPLLSDFLMRNQELLPRLRVENAEATLAFISSVCEYYQSIKAVRPLVEEEKQVGRMLGHLLDVVSEELKDVESSVQQPSA